MGSPSPTIQDVTITTNPLAEPDLRAGTVAPTRTTVAPAMTSQYHQSIEALNDTSALPDYEYTPNVSSLPAVEMSGIPLTTT